MLTILSIDTHAHSSDEILEVIVLSVGGPALYFISKQKSKSASSKAIYFTTI